MDGSGWEWMGVDGSGWEWIGLNSSKFKSSSQPRYRNRSSSDEGLVEDQTIVSEGFVLMWWLKLAERGDRDQATDVCGGVID